MDKRNRLKINTPETSFTFGADESIVVPPKIMIGTTSENVKDFNLLNQRSSETINFLKKYFPTILAILAVSYVIFRPSEYSELLDEIYNLRKENNQIKMKQELENIALITNKVRVEPRSKIYRYGFFKLNFTDPNSILESNGDCFALDGSDGCFEIIFPENKDVRKIAIYHSSNANIKSSIREFKLKLNEKVYDLKYDGVGYQEFTVNGNVDKIIFNIINNHGEKLYTSVYRVYVFSR